MALRTLCITIDCPLKRESVARVVRDHGHPLLRPPSRRSSGEPAGAAVSPRRLRDIVGTSSPVVSFRSRMVTRSTFMTSNIMSTTLPEQAVEVELAGELLRDVEQQRQLLAPAAPRRCRAATRSWPRRSGRSRLVMPGGPPPLTIELADDVAARSRAAPAELPRRRSGPAGRPRLPLLQPEERPCRR